MALFGSKKKATPAKKAPAKVAAESTETKRVTPAALDLKSVIRRPRLTEKAANLSTQNVYTFDVTRGSSKHDIVRAIKSLYKVTPTRVNVVNTKGKKVSLRTRRGFGVKNNTRKAYVFLKKGDVIDFAA